MVMYLVTIVMAVSAGVEAIHSPAPTYHMSRDKESFEALGACCCKMTTLKTNGGEISAFHCYCYSWHMSWVPDIRCQTVYTIKKRSFWNVSVEMRPCTAQLEQVILFQRWIWQEIDAFRGDRSHQALLHLLMHNGFKAFWLLSQMHILMVMHSHHYALLILIVGVRTKEQSGQ